MMGERGLDLAHTTILRWVRRYAPEFIGSTVRLHQSPWMMVLGPGVRQNAVVDRPVDSLDLVPTLGSLLGFSPTYAKGSPLREVL